MTQFPLEGRMVVNEHGLCCENNGICILSDGITFTGGYVDWLLAVANALKTYKGNYPSERRTDMAIEFIFFKSQTYKK